MYVMNCKYSERGQINATNDCNTALQITLQELIHPDLNDTRVVNTNFKSAYFSLWYEGKNVSQLLQLGPRVGGMAYND